MSTARRGDRSVLGSWPHPIGVISGSRRRWSISSRGRHSWPVKGREDAALHRREGIVPENAEEVVGTPADLTGHRQTGPLVVEAPLDRQVICVIRRATARGGLGDFVERPPQRLRTLTGEVPGGRLSADS